MNTDQDAVVEPALEGTWTSDTNDKEKIVLQKSGDYEYDLAVFCTDEEFECPNTTLRQNYAAHLVRLGGQLFMDLIFKDQTVHGAEVSDPFGAVHAYVIAKVKISGDDLAYMPRWTMVRSRRKAFREALRWTMRWLTDLLCL